jgi:hypothetical protein
MHEASGVPALPGHRVHQRQDRIADIVGLLAQEIEVECSDVGTRRDCRGRFSGNDAAFRLRLRQRDLDLGIAANERVVGKHFAHARGAEGVAEQERVEDGGGWGGGTHGDLRLGGICSDANHNRGALDKRLRRDSIAL